MAQLPFELFITRLSPTITYLEEVARAGSDKSQKAAEVWKAIEQVRDSVRRLQETMHHSGPATGDLSAKSVTEVSARNPVFFEIVQIGAFNGQFSVRAMSDREKRGYLERGV